VRLSGSAAFGLPDFALLPGPPGLPRLNFSPAVPRLVFSLSSCLLSCAFCCAASIVDIERFDVLLLVSERFDGLQKECFDVLLLMLERFDVLLLVL
jgi:pyruvate-formate lyase-activating enzyme